MNATGLDERTLAQSYLQSFSKLEKKHFPNPNPWKMSDVCSIYYNVGECCKMILSVKGSLLGPTFFPFYINDGSKNILGSLVNIYADDNTKNLDDQSLQLIFPLT